jgi:hypothetical protein
VYETFHTNLHERGTMSDVLFRGPMMVFTQNGVAESIRIPNAEAETCQRFHPDGDPATEHTSGLLVTEPSNTQTTAPPKRVYRLKARKITISDGTTGDCVADASLSRLMVNVKRLTENGATGQPLQPVPVNADFFEKDGSTIVEFRGGRLSVDPNELTGLTYTIPGHFAKNGIGDTLRIPMLIKWTPEPGSEVKIDIEYKGKESGPPPFETITLAANQTACFYQWDGPPSATRPQPAAFLNLAPVTCVDDSDAVIDVDFKWVYEMLTPVDGDWAKWRNGKKLPAPISVCAAGKDPDFVAQVFNGAEAKTAPGKDCLGGLFG